MCFNCENGVYSWRLLLSGSWILNDFFRATLFLIKKRPERVRYVQRISHKVFILLAVGAYIIFFCGSYVNGQLDVVMFVKCVYVRRLTDGD